MDYPQNATEHCMFIGCINYYPNMWLSHIHILEPLTDHSGLKNHTPIPWKTDRQTEFGEMNALITADMLAAYPENNKWFNIYTNVSDFQVGAGIIQDGRSVAFFSCKLSKSQQN